MPLPIAHGILGASVVLAAREPEKFKPTVKALLLGAGLGILPDVDLVFAWWLGWGAWAHGGPTHSVLFAFFIALLVARWRQEWRIREILIYGCALLTHGVGDMLVRKEFGGAALYWPFSDEKLRFGLFDYFEFFPGTDPLAQVVWRAVEISFYELLIFAPCLLLAGLIRWSRVRTRQWERRPVRVS